MDYLKQISKEIDKEEELLTVGTELITTIVSDERDCEHDQVLGDPRSGGICLFCNEHLSSK